ncbi:MAG: YdcF family protein [Nanoarchaeota archaeon]|nr:YdcF family protein [Nanoarchaeota archaeon]
MVLDAIVILGSQVKQDGSIDDFMKFRLDKGIEIFNENIASYLIMSGKYGFLSKEKPPITEAEAMKKYAIEHDIPEDKLLLEDQSKDTIGNAYFTKIKYLKPRNWNKLVIVTSDFHLKRTEYVFNKILGADYQIEYIGVDSHLSEQEMVKMNLVEDKVISFLKNYVDLIDPKDDEKTKQLLYSEHPAYAKNPKITREDILKKLRGE